MPGENASFFSDYLTKLNPYYRYRIWAADYSTGKRIVSTDSPVICASNFEQFYIKAFPSGFFSGHGFSCVIVCDYSTEYSASSKIYERVVENELVHAFHEPILPLSLMANDATTLTSDADIQKAFKEYLVHNAKRLDNQVMFHVGRNAIFSHIAPDLPADDALLGCFTNAIRFEVLLPFLCGKNLHKVNKEIYEDVADLLGRPNWSPINQKHFTAKLLSVSEQIGSDYPAKWCVLITIPYEYFDSIFAIVKEGYCPYIDRIIQIQPHGAVLMAACLDAKDSLDELDKLVNETFSIAVEDLELLSIEKELFKKLTESKTLNH